MTIGYVRVSTKEQNTKRQEVIMVDLGVDKIFLDRISGKNTSRPELQNMLSFVRDGDCVIVESIESFSSSINE